jgi:hypothetical protein
MDISHHTRWGIALAAAALALTSACGSELAPSPNDIGGVGQEEQQAPRPTGWPECFNGSADAAARTCAGTSEDSGGNRARLDFGDAGRG